MPRFPSRRQVLRALGSSVLLPALAGAASFARPTMVRRAAVRPKVGIIGGGIGGVAAAIEVRDSLKKAHQVTVISDLPNFQFTPSNPWLAVNWRKN